MRFYLDEDLSPIIAHIVRQLGYDAVSVHDLEREGLSDDVQLTLAAAAGRILVSINRDDMIALTERFYYAGRPHAGVLIVPSNFAPNRFSAVAHALAAFAQMRPAGMQPYEVDFLKGYQS